MQAGHPQSQVEVRIRELFQEFVSITNFAIT